MTLTQAERQALLDDAIDAVRALLDDRSPTPPEGWPVTDKMKPNVKRDRLFKRASEAVTAAVVHGDHIHTKITIAVRYSGLTVVRLIADDDARATALTVEVNATENYRAQVLRERREEAVRRVAQGDYGIKSEVARVFGVRRATLDEWLGVLSTRTH